MAKFCAYSHHMATKTCTNCQKTKPLSDFYLRSSSGRPYSWCKLCYNAKGAARYVAKREEILAGMSDYNKRRRELHKEVVFDHYGQRCACCGVTEPVFLTVDHIGGGGSAHRKITKSIGMWGWLIRNDFPPGFQILCWNCNAAKHFAGVCPHQEVASHR